MAIIANARNLNAAWRHTSHSRLFLANFVVCICATTANNQLLIKILTSPDLLKDSSKLTITRRFHAVTLTFDTWPWTFAVHPMSGDQTLYQIRPKSNNPRQSYWWFSTLLLEIHHAVTLTFLTPWPWTFVTLHRVSLCRVGWLKYKTAKPLTVHAVSPERELDNS